MTCGEVISELPPELAEVIASIPQIQTETKDVKTWFQNRDRSVVTLVSALNPSDWVDAGKERALGTIIQDPESVLNNVIVGVDQGETHDTFTTSIFAGLAIELKNVNSNGYAFYHVLLKTNEGIKEVPLTGAHSVKIYRPLKD
jgi:hypothetical protein